MLQRLPRAISAITPIRNQTLDKIFSRTNPVIMSFFGNESDKLFLRENLTRTLVRKHKKTLENLSNEWGPPGDKRIDDYPPAPGRSTIYNWVTDGFPGIETGPSRHQLLAFCAQLDADPLALFDYQRNGYFSAFAKLRTALQRGAGALGALGPLLDLYRPDQEWPCNELAERLWQKPWSYNIFDNLKVYRSTNYARLNVRFDDDSTGDPRAVHVAYRRWNTKHIDPMWRFYGTVIAIEDRLELYNEGGVHQKMHREDDNVIAFRTYFGGRPVEFKLASLHSFSMDADYPFDDMSVIGFDW